jgi:protein-histidine pros-kinase
LGSDVVNFGSFASAEEAVVFVADVLDASTEYAIVAIDADARVVGWNEGARRLYGYEAAEIVGHPHSVFQTEAEVQAKLPEQMLDRALGEGKWTGTVLHVRRDGSQFSARVVMTPRRDVRAGSNGFLLISSETRGDMVPNPPKANIQPQRMSWANHGFLASVSHELRTPLNAILGFTQLVLMGADGHINEEQAEQLQTVQSSGRQLLSLIDDLIDVASIESGGTDLVFERIECTELLEEVAILLRPRADEKGLTLEVPAANGWEVNCDRRSLQQVLSKLTNNAIRFTDQGGVRLDLSRGHDDSGAVTRFSVIDTGRGIGAADQERLLAAFNQSRFGRGRAYEGTGIGLYLCQTLAGLMGAQISFESELGKGSGFWVDVR